MSVQKKFLNLFLFFDLEDYNYSDLDRYAKIQLSSDDESLIVLLSNVSIFPSGETIRLLQLNPKNVFGLKFFVTAINFQPMCEEQTLQIAICHAYPGNQENSVDGRSTIFAASSTVLWTVRVS